MLRSRLIPVLLMHQKGLTKTVRFKNGKYIGDPLNAVKIFNEQQADELMLLDIDASAEGTEPNFRLIENIAAECRMPLCYGGGIKTVEQAEKILQLGVEKVSLSSIVFENPKIVKELSDRVGKQSVVVCLDIKRRLVGGNIDCYTINGRIKQKIDVLGFAKYMQDLGAGEIVINSIDSDGVMKGYDLSVIRRFSEALSVPLTLVGGAGCKGDIQKLIEQEGLVGAGVGSMFVFKGKYKAVLINYPTQSEKQSMLSKF